MKRLLFLIPLLVLLLAGCTDTDALIQVQQQQLQILQQQQTQIQRIETRLDGIQNQLGQVQYQTTQIQQQQPIEKTVLVEKPVYIPVPIQQPQRFYVPPLPAQPQPWRNHPDWQRWWNQTPYADQQYFQYHP